MQFSAQYHENEANADEAESNSEPRSVSLHQVSVGAFACSNNLYGRLASYFGAPSFLRPGRMNKGVCRIKTAACEFRTGLGPVAYEYAI